MDLKNILIEESKSIEIAEKVEEKIRSLGGLPAFPVNLSLNDSAAHSVPDIGDETKFLIHCSALIAKNQKKRNMSGL